MPRKLVALKSEATTWEVGTDPAQATYLQLSVCVCITHTHTHTTHIHTHKCTPSTQTHQIVSKALASVSGKQRQRIAFFHVRPVWTAVSQDPQRVGAGAQSLQPVLNAVFVCVCVCVCVCTSEQQGWMAGR